MIARVPLGVMCEINGRDVFTDVCCFRAYLALCLFSVHVFGQRGIQIWQLSCDTWPRVEGMLARLRIN